MNMPMANDEQIYGRYTLQSATLRSQNLPIVLFFLTSAVVLLSTDPVGGLSFALMGTADETKPLRIGMAKTFFTEQSKGNLDIATEDFKLVLKKMTGFDSELFLDYNAAELAEKVNKKQLDLGIFHGHEFAWFQKKYSDFQPIMVAVNKQHDLRAYLVVRKDSAVKNFADLRGKNLGMPVATKEFCRLYMQRHCTDKEHETLAKFFNSVEKSPTPESALDDLARGKLDATIVDSMALALYKEIRGPVFDKNLKILNRSEPFPPAVVVYKKGTLTDATVTKFRDGLINAADVPEGREMMESWKITTFEKISLDYDKRLTDILKAYTPPESTR